MAVSEQFLDELTARTDIVELVSGYLPLTRKGANLWGLCPFHGEKTPSFSVSPEKQIFHCFGCGKGGGAIRFVQEMEHVNFREAVRVLAAQAGLSVPDEADEDREWRARRLRLMVLLKDAARFYYDTLQSPQGEAAAAYIARRRISPKFARLFGLGAAPDAWDALLRAMTDRGYDKRELVDAGLVVANKTGGFYDKFRNRLMLPVIDPRGDVLGFTSRVMREEDAPKYLNTPETSVFKKRSVLYGLNLARNSKRSGFLLVEGNIDVISLHQAGFDHAVATMGTALTTEHVQLMGKYTKELTLCYDNDTAGLDATERAMTVLRKSDFTVKVLALPKRLGEDGQYYKQDPDDFIRLQGAGAFHRLLEGSEDQTAYRLGGIRAKYDLASDEARAAFLQEAADMIASLSSPVEREIYANRAAAEAEISRDAMLREVESRRTRLAAKGRRQAERQAMAVSQRLQPKARALRYKNVRSAQAEGGALRILLQEPGLLKQAEGLAPEQFSVPLFAQVFTLLRERGREGRQTAVAHLEERFSPEEMDHLAAVLGGEELLANAAAALGDYIEIIRTESAKKNVTSDAEFLEMTDLLRKRKLEDRK